MSLLRTILSDANAHLMGVLGESARYRETSADSWRDVDVQWATARDEDVGFVQDVGGQQQTSYITVRVKLGSGAREVSRIVKGAVFEITSGNAETLEWPVSRQLGVEDGYARVLCERQVITGFGGRRIGQRQ